MGSTTREVLDVARKAIDIFAKHGLKCCLVGGVASYLYGVSRTPSDVDLVVLSTLYDQESLKRILVNENSRFYLVPSKNYHATYKVLWYSLTSSSSYTYHSSGYDCKVDIFTPGIMNIPHVPLGNLTMISGYPVMPLLPQLLLKLQAWSDHRESRRTDMQAKQYVDISDIDKLLDIAVARGVRVRSVDVSWVPESMITAAHRRLLSYTRVASPDSAAGWRKLGFTM